jgi:tetratricopeptide (TPR) repeat protein
MEPRHEIATSPARAALLAAGAALFACAGAHAAGAGRAPEVLVEVLPRGAEVELDGRSVGRGGGTVAAPVGAAHVLRVTAPGFVAEERALPADLDGSRVGAALRPDGLAGDGAIDLEDAPALAAAAELLVAQRSARDARDYAERAATADPALPVAQRVLGDALWSLGDRRRAVDAWRRAVRLASGGPEADAAARRIRDAGETISP